MYDRSTTGTTLVWLVVVTVTLVSLRANWVTLLSNLSAVENTRIVMTQLQDLSVLHPLGLCQVEARDVVEEPRDRSLGNALYYSVPSYPSAVRLLADGRHIEAHGLLQELQTGGQWHAMEEYALGLAEYQAGESARACAHWRRVGASNLFIRLGQQCDSLNKETAIAYYKLALATVPPDQADQYLTLGRAFRSHFELQYALAALKEAARIRPGDFDVLFLAGLSAYELRDPVIAAEFLERAVEIAPRRNSYAYAMLGSLQEESGNLELAFNWFQRAHLLFPTDSGFHYRMGLVRFSQTRYMEAIQYFEQAYKLEPRPDYLFFLAQAALGLGDLARAREMLEQAIEQAPADTRSQLTLARVCMQLADTPCARAAYQAVLLVNPENQEARQGLQTLGSHDASNP